MKFRLGIPKEIKDQEGRVGMTPDFVHELTSIGHEVLVQRMAGVGVGASDSRYKDAGAVLVDSISDVYAAADLIIKIKEPLEEEFPLIREGQIIFTFLHLAAEPKLTQQLVNSKCRAVAYETVTDKNGRLPLLAPSSKVAGRVGIYKAIQYLQFSEFSESKGILFGGVPGVKPAKVVIIGCGYAGLNAAQMALGAGGEVSILDINSSSLDMVSSQFRGGVRTLYGSRNNLLREIRDADVVVGAALVAGDRAPKLLTREDLKSMERGSVIVDISIDQGGCFETSRRTSHSNPVFIKDGILHYCVTNMPGIVPRTSSNALNAVVFPFVKAIADLGLDAAMKRDSHLKNGLNVDRGEIVHPTIRKIFPDL